MKAIGEAAFKDGYSVYGVVFPEGLECIEASAFERASNIDYMPICFYAVRNHGEGKRTKAPTQIDSVSYTHIESCRCSERSKPLSSQPAIVFAGFFTKKGRRCICLQNRYDKYTRTCYNRKRASGLIGSGRKAKKLEAVISNPGDKTPHEALEYGKFLIITSFQC